MQLVVDKTLVSYQELNPQAKKTFIVLHGWGQEGKYWVPIAENLPKDYRYILLDLPGFGQSNYLPGDPSIPQYTDLVASFIKKLGIKKPILFGHSFGGQIATNLAAEYPEILSQLFLLSPSAIRIRTTKRKLISTFIKYLRFSRKILPEYFVNFLRRLLSSRDYANALKEQRRILSQIVRQDLRHQLSKIKVPTHIIWGDKDIEITYQGKFLAEKIPESTLHILYGADHNPHLFKPDDLTKLINQTLDASN